MSLSQTVLTADQHGVRFGEVGRHARPRLLDHLLDAQPLLPLEAGDRHVVLGGGLLIAEDGRRGQVQRLPRGQQLALQHDIVQPVGGDAAFRIADGLHHHAVPLRTAEHYCGRGKGVGRPGLNCAGPPFIAAADCIITPGPPGVPGGIGMMPGPPPAPRCTGLPDHDLASVLELLLLLLLLLLLYLLLLLVVQPADLLLLVQTGRHGTADNDLLPGARMCTRMARPALKGGLLTLHQRVLGLEPVNILLLSGGIQLHQLLPGLCIELNQLPLHWRP
uniref:Uncharacterized protein n=1 Tax=Anopheles merus TaxID=30066 RepID=A0A182V2B0_ANOME